LGSVGSCSRISRTCSPNVSPIMLTARGQETDKIVGLEVGADDYVTKPFSIKELLARVRAHLRRSTNGVRTLERYRFGDVELDFKKYRAVREGRPIDLSPREFEILKCLILHENEIVTRDQLLDEVWGLENYPITRTVDNHIAKLRQKIETSPSNPEHISLSTESGTNSLAKARPHEPGCHRGVIAFIPIYPNTLP